MTINPENGVPIGDRLGTERLYEQLEPGLTLPPPALPNLQAVPPPPRPKGKREKRAKQPPAPTPDRAAQAKLADRNWRNISSNCLELAGIVAITAGCALIATYLAFIVGGILVVVLGVAIGLQVTD